MLKHALLGLLTYAPMTGYDLKQIMDQSTSNFWHAKQSQIYTTLKKMEAEGWVRSKVEAQAGKPDRRVYSLQPKGETALRGWLAESPEALQERKEIMLLRLFFSAPLGKDAIQAQLRQQRELHEKQLATYQSETRAVIEGFAKQLPEYEEDAWLWEATRRFGELRRPWPSFRIA